MCRDQGASLRGSDHSNAELLEGGVRIPPGLIPLEVPPTELLVGDLLEESFVTSP
ncbi:hypothetical protein [Streptomyces sp. NPDC001194]|uniref:hypothetical protein n=1 Tax=Streptomyces sp. NPDC001194 TaxID=3364547 RepID=UPI0036B08C5B